MITPEQLDAWEKLANEATPEPWRADPDADGSLFLASEEFLLPDSDEDIRFIAAAREAVPALIAEVRRLRSQYEGLRHDLLESRKW